MGKVKDWLANQQAKFQAGLDARGQSLLGKIWNDWTGITNTNKSLQAQSEENEKTRRYNLELAQKQNQWNIEQWNRENAYNSPTAQKARLEAAGLNPDLMYGQGGISNTAASSPDMTAGAPGTPMDWSPLANTKTLGQVFNETLNNEMIRAQIDSIKAGTKKTLADAGLSQISLEYADAEKRLGLKISEQQFEKAKQDYELGVKALEKASGEIEGIALDNAYKAIRQAFESETMQLQINLLSEELNIKKAESKHALEYYAAQLLGLQADNAWKDAAWIVEQRDGVPTMIKYGSQALNKLVDVLVNFIPGKGKDKGKSIVINNNIPKNIPKK